MSVQVELISDCNRRVPAVYPPCPRHITALASVQVELGRLQLHVAPEMAAAVGALCARSVNWVGPMIEHYCRDNEPYEGRYKDFTRFGDGMSHIGPVEVRLRARYLVGMLHDVPPMSAGNAELGQMLGALQRATLQPLQEAIRQQVRGLRARRAV